MSKKKTFDSRQLSIIIGTHIVSGYSENSILTLSLDAPEWVETVDANGVTTRRKNNNNNATAVINLTQASPSNDVLSTYLNLDRQFSTGSFPVVIKDNNGSMLVTSDEAYIDVSANGNIDATGENERSWTIKLIDAGWFIGGLA
jgi:hypothetical protein